MEGRNVYKWRSGTYDLIYLILSQEWMTSPCTDHVLIPFQYGSDWNLDPGVVTVCVCGEEGVG